MIDLLDTELLDDYKVGDKIEVRFTAEFTDSRIPHKDAIVERKADASVIHIKYADGEEDHIEMSYDDYEDELYIASFKYGREVKILPLDN